MKLTQLEIFGFKSFAERTKLLFNGGVTGVVGPNGCGKSNVIDAIRWVLGEQSSRTLRSDKMENVIFNGTAKRKPANFAEVAITFDNDRGILPAEYPYLTLTRKLYRDGAGEYFINQIPCRLKDINQLLQGTGIGPDSFAIIEQEMVKDLIADKNNAQRQLLENAAGISKYKQRKKETLTQLQDIDEKVSRIEDILFEIDKNLKQLEKQAKRTEKYFRLKAQYKQISCQVAYLRAGHYAQEMQQLENLIQQTDQQLADIQTHYRQQLEKKTAIQHILTEKEHEKEKHQHRLQQSQEHYRQVETEIRIQKEKIELLHTQKTNLIAQITGQAAEIQRIHARQQTLENLIDTTNEAYDTQEFLILELEKEYQDLDTAVQNRRKQVEEISRNLRTVEQKLQLQHREYDSRQIQSQTLNQEIQRLQTEILQRTQDLQNTNTHIQTLTIQLQEAQTRLQQLQHEKENIQNQLIHNNQQIETQKDLIYQTQRQIDAYQNEYDLTKSLIENMEGYPDSLKFLKKHPQWQTNARLLSDLFDVQEKYKTPIENYLEPFLNYYVVYHRAQALHAITLLQEAQQGRANFFIINELTPPPVHPHPPADWIPALTVITIPENFYKLAEYLLNNVYIVADWSVFNAHINENNTLIGLIHSSGQIIMRNSILSGGSAGVFEGKRLGRAQNLERLSNQILHLKQTLHTQQLHLQNLQQQQQQLRTTDPTKIIEQQQRHLTRLNQQKTALAVRQEEAQIALQRLQHRFQQAQTEIQTLENQQQNQDPQIQELQDQVNQLTTQLQQQQILLTNRTNEYTRVSQEYNTQNLKLNALKSQIDTYKTEFRLLNAQIEQIHKNTELYQQEIQNIEKEHIILTNTHTSHADRLNQISQEIQHLQDQFIGSKNRLDTARKSFDEIQTLIDNIHQQKENLQLLRESYHQKQTDIRIQLSNITQRLEVEFNIALSDLTPENLFNNEEQIQHPTPEMLPELEKELLSIREKVQKFGEVNPDAVEQYDQMKQRYDFINEQKNDLLKAKNDLLNTIQEMDQTARIQFLETFQKVRENFIQVFRTLFTEHDTCDITLTGSNEPLEAEIEITARPKGKRPLTINQLSGGEKTLTAVSLLFAIYLLKPAPFCIFDEVDAPLDDANIEKFNNIIRDFSSHSQFIIVTHNKRTMVKTQLMYGVTMEETGVSRVLPVDLVTLNLAESV